MFLFTRQPSNVYDVYVPSGNTVSLDSMVWYVCRQHTATQNGTTTHARAQRTRSICLSLLPIQSVCVLFECVQTAFVFSWIYYTTLRYLAACIHAYSHSTDTMGIHKHPYRRMLARIHTCPLVCTIHTCRIHTAQHNAIQTSVTHNNKKENQLPSFDVPRTGTKKIQPFNVRSWKCPDEHLCDLSHPIYIHLTYLSILHLYVYRNREWLIVLWVCFFLRSNSVSFSVYLFWHQQYAKKINSNRVVDDDDDETKEQYNTNSFDFQLCAV